MIRYCTISKKGDREVNEDAVGGVVLEKGALFVVADGLGGHGCGDTASRYTVGSFLEFYFTDRSRTVSAEEYLMESFQRIQNGMQERQKRQHRMAEMKSTAAVVVCESGRITVGHIGDSRVYLFGEKKLFWRTIDHSVPQMLALAGEIPEKAIRRHPDRNKILHALGNTGDELRIDRKAFEHPEEIRALLLCSDGFWEYIDERHMLSTLRHSTSPEEWMEKMEKIVLKNGRRSRKLMDNYSAAAVLLEMEKETDG